MNQDRDICTLMVYLIYERLQGEDSFYFPYLDVVESPTPTCFWPTELLERSDHKEFRYGMIEARKKCDVEWAKMDKHIARYPQLFPPEKVSKDLYMWALGFVQSRAFGWGLPCTMLVPLADCLNHSNASYVGPDLLEPNLHKAMDKTYLYRHNFDKASR